MCYFHSNIQLKFHQKLTLHSLAKLAAKQQYIQKVRASADQQGKIAEAKLKSKMETYGENKNAIERALHSRLNAKEERIKDVKAKNQALIDSQCKEIEEKIQSKLSQSEEKTEALRQALKEKLQAHDQKLKEAKNVVQEKVVTHCKITEEKLQKKMEIYSENRQTILEGLKDRVHDKNVTVEQKKQIHEEECALIQQLYEEKLQSKMVKYEENRAALLKAKKEQLHAHNSLVQQKCILAKERKVAQRG